MFFVVKPLYWYKKMRRLLFLLFCFPIWLGAQVSFTAADLPRAGDTVYLAIDGSFPDFFAAATGPGLTWDFSGLYPSDLARNVYLRPAETPFADTFPEANLALRIDFDAAAYSFFQQDSSQITILGVTANIPELGGEQLIKFKDPQRVLDLPLILGDILVDTTRIEAEVQEPTTGADLLFKSEQYSQTITDASGDLILPGGTFSAFRQKVATERIDSLFVLVFGTPVFLEREVSMDTSYLWISAEARGVILNKDPDGNWLYYAPELANLKVPLAGFDRTVSTDSTVQFMDTSEGMPFSWSWNFGDGNTSTERNPVHEYDSIGVYEVCLTVANSAGRDSLCQRLTLRTTSVENTARAQYWQVFPNPTDDWIIFRYLGLAAERYQLEVFNSIGQCITQRFFYESTQLNTQNWTADVYIYRISQDGRLLRAGRFLKK